MLPMYTQTHTHTHIREVFYMYISYCSGHERKHLLLPLKALALNLIAIKNSTKCVVVLRHRDILFQKRLTGKNQSV